MEMQEARASRLARAETSFAATDSALARAANASSRNCEQESALTNWLIDDDTAKWARLLTLALAGLDGRQPKPRYKAG